MENICMCKERGCLWPLPLKKNLNSLNAFSKIFLKTRWEGARMVVANFLMQESFVGVGQVTMSNKTVQQDECYSPFWNFFSSVHLFSCVWLFVTPWTATRQASPSITTPRDCSNSRALSHIHLAISSSVIPFYSCLQSYPASGSFPRSQFFTSGGQRIGVQFQHQSFQWISRTQFLQDGLIGSPCHPRDSQVSSPTPQLISINSSMLSFLYSPALTSTHDYWKNHSFDLDEPLLAK